jgi:hypothetical protein
MNWKPGYYNREVIDSLFLAGRRDGSFWGIFYPTTDGYQGGGDWRRAIDRLNIEALRTNLRTEAEPQQIVAQRLLSCLQYPVP